MGITGKGLLQTVAGCVTVAERRAAAHLLSPGQVITSHLSRRTSTGLLSLCPLCSSLSPAALSNEGKGDCLSPAQRFPTVSAGEITLKQKHRRGNSRMTQG